MLRVFSSTVVACFLLGVVCVYVITFSTAWTPPQNQPRYVFATFLGTFTAIDDSSRQSQIDKESVLYEPDGYYIGARYLNYMLRYNEDTRSRHGYPLLVILAEGVEEYKINRLQL